MTPVRAAYAQDSHAAASATNRELTGRGISIQAWGLRAKVLAADAWARTATTPVWEVHPEVAFTLLRDGALPIPATFSVSQEFDEIRHYVRVVVVKLVCRGVMAWYGRHVDGLQTRQEHQRVASLAEAALPVDQGRKLQ